MIAGGKPLKDCPPLKAEPSLGFDMVDKAV
jgi:hypothetical protein